MKPSDDEKFTAWIDEKLSGQELTDFERLLTEHPEAEAEKKDAQRLGDLLRRHSVAPTLNNPDFFNHQLMQRIAAETPKAAEKEKKRSFWSFLTMNRVAWATACGLAVAFFAKDGAVQPAAVVVPPPHDENYFAQVVEAWTPDPSISATTVYSSKDSATVVWLDGLDYMPATVALN